jgi:hypothetical protein
MLEFARNFTKATVRVFALEHAKLAVHEWGNYVAVRSPRTLASIVTYTEPHRATHSHT